MVRVYRPARLARGARTQRSPATREVIAVRGRGQDHGSEGRRPLCALARAQARLPVGRFAEPRALDEAGPSQAALGRVLAHHAVGQPAAGDRVRKGGRADRAQAQSRLASLHATCAFVLIRYLCFCASTTLCFCASTTLCLLIAIRGRGGGEGTSNLYGWPPRGRTPGLPRKSANFRLFQNLRTMKSPTAKAQALLETTSC
jgi:hypothetical protein